VNQVMYHKNIVPVNTKRIRYSVFELAGLFFAVEISTVREVLNYPKVSRLPNADAIHLGVFNLRGRIISLLDIRYLLGLETGDFESTDMVMILEKDDTLFGILVKRVLNFIDIEEIKIQLPSRKVQSSIANYILGLYEKENLEVIYLIDTVRLVNSIPYH